MSETGRGGDGDREADRRYRERTREFVEKENVEEKAREAEPADASEAARLMRAERAGERRSREEDPQVGRDYTESGSQRQ